MINRTGPTNVLHGVESWRVLLGTTRFKKKRETARKPALCEKIAVSKQTQNGKEKTCA